MQAARCASPSADPSPPNAPEVRGAELCSHTFICPIDVNTGTYFKGSANSLQTLYVTYYTIILHTLHIRIQAYIHAYMYIYNFNLSPRRWVGTFPAPHLEQVRSPSQTCQIPEGRGGQAALGSGHRTSGCACCNPAAGCESQRGWRPCAVMDLRAW